MYASLISGLNKSSELEKYFMEENLKIQALCCMNWRSTKQLSFLYRIIISIIIIIILEWTLKR